MARGVAGTLGLLLVTAVPAAASTADVPPAPTIGATGNLRSVELNWVYPHEIAHSSFVVYRGASPDDLGKVAEVAAKPYDPDGPSFDERFTDVAVTVGTTYYYALATVGPDGEGPHGDAVAATPVGTGVLAVSGERSGNGDHDVVALAAGGMDTRLTSGAGDNLAPAASPDGSLVAFSSNRDNAHPDDYDLWVLPIGKAPYRVTQGAGSADGEPAFSADGTTLAFTRTAAGATSVWTVPVTGGAPVQVPNSGGDSQPSWSPTGRMLAVTHGGTTIVQTNLAGTFRRPYRNGGGQTYDHPSWSPTGARMSYVVHNKAGSYLLTCFPDSGDCRGPLAQSYAPTSGRWAPDGTRIVFDGTSGGQGGLYTVVWNSDQTAAVPGGGWSRFSAPVIVSPPARYVAPAQSSAVAPFAATTIGPGSVRLDWIRPPGAHWAEIRRSAAGGAAPATSEDGISVYAGNLAQSATATGLATGKSYAFTAFFRDFNGALIRRQELTARTVAAPAIGPNGSVLAALSGDGPSFTASWGPALPAGMTYEVQAGTRAKQGSAWGEPAYRALYSGRGTKAVVKAVAGTTYYLRVRVHDGGAATEWSAPVVAPVPYDDRALTAKGKWRAKSGQAGRFGATARVSGEKGASLTLGQDGSSFALVAERCPTCGKVGVYVDGVLKATVDTYAKSSAVRQVVWSTSFKAIGRHTLRFVVLGTAKRPEVRVDGVAARR